MRSWVRAGCLVSLGAFGIGICLYYGRRGFLALDQSIVFDGGWRVLTGDWPLAGFVAPAGAVPSIVQAAFFAAFGVSWFAYCLHAAIVNGLFAMAAFALLRACGAGTFAAWAFGMLSAVIFYPPFGVPYPDQHSFFFSLLCVLATVKALAPRRASPLWIAAVPAFAAAAWFSKPIPAALVIPWCAFAVVWHAARRDRPARGPLAGGVVFVVSVLIVYVVALRVDVPRAIYYSVTLPLRLGVTRAPLDVRVRFVWDELQHQIVPASPCVTIAFAGAAIVYAIARRRARSIVATALLGLGCLVVCAVFVVLTNNGAVNGLPLMFVAAGLAWVAFDRALELRQAGNSRRTAKRRIALAVVLLVCGVDAVRFNAVVNARRIVHDQVWDAGARRWSPGGRLTFMQLNDAWFGGRNIVDILQFIDRYGQNFLLVGDSSAIYGASGRPSISPALWFHPSLTVPPKDTQAFDAFERELVSRVRRHNVRYVIQEGYATRMGVRLDDFPAIVDLVRGCRTAAVGSWTLLEICR